MRLVSDRQLGVTISAKRRARVHALCAIGVLSIVGACALQPPRVAPEVPTRDSEASTTEPALSPPAPAPIERLTPREHVRRSLDLIHSGELEAARAHLERALVLEPGYAQAQTLRDQLDVDPVAALGAQNFAYQVQAGDTLSGLAATYLGDHLRFVLLARYNNIANPSLLEVGQVLRIPGSAAVAAPRAARQERQPGREPEVYAVPRTEAIERLPLVEPIVVGTDEVEAAVAPRGERSDDGAQAPAATGTAAEAATFYARATEYERKGQLEAAYALYRRVLELAPEHADAGVRAERVKKELVGDYHREAVLLARGEGIAQAIAIWERVLELDPEHAEAKQGLAKARASSDAQGGND